MRTFLLSFIHITRCFFLMLRPGGAKTLAAENLALKQQLIVLNRSRKRAPNLTVADRLVFGFCAQLINPQRLHRIAVVIQPSTIKQFHKFLIQRKHDKLFAPKTPFKPGPKGPADDVIELVVELKRRNPTFGCPRIAFIVNNTLKVDIDKDVVRRILQKHCRPGFNGTDGPSWLTFFADAKDSLWSLDLFRCESIVLNTHGVLAIMDVHSRRIVGLAVHRGPVDANALCSIFASAIAGNSPPRYISTDHDPLFESYRWQSCLRVLEVEEIRSVPYTPQSHPYIERLIGTVRREYLDHTLFWTAGDLERKLGAFAEFYNQYRAHSSLNGDVPTKSIRTSYRWRKEVSQIAWRSHLNGLYQLPMAA